MSKRRSWLIVLLAVALLVAACGPEMATPTPGAKSEATSALTSTAPAAETPESQPPPSGELPVAADDWHVLGEPDAPVTITEYSDFQ